MVGARGRRREATPRPCETSLNDASEAPATRMPHDASPSPPWYPFLASAYLVIGLAAANGGELIDPTELYWPLLISLSITLGVWLISGLVTKDRSKRALLTLVGVIVLEAFGRFAAALRNWPPVAEFGTDTVALPLAIISLVAFTDLIRRSRRQFGAMSHYLNIVAGILLVWSGGQFLWNTRAGRDAAPMKSVARSDSLMAQPTSAKPDFFLIVLDKYTGAHSLLANYGFDDSHFLDFLKQTGFVVPGTARANYNHTSLALAAMLNWQYLDTLAAGLGRDNRNWGAVYPLIEDNRVSRTLKQAGYKFIFFPTAFAATERNRHADEQLPDPKAMTREFRSVWLDTTILPPLLQSICPLLGCSSESVPYAPESATSLDWKFRRIPELATRTEPVFVFAHLTVPHEPYLYDAQCDHRTPYWPDRDDGAEALKVKAAYIDQIRCINAKVERLVTEILTRTRRETIIVLQADHGHGRLGRYQPALDKASPSQVAERTDIFAAYYLPDAARGLISDSIGPVNAIRAIMRHYYSMPLPPLPEETFWSSQDYPYAFTQVR